MRKIIITFFVGSVLLAGLTACGVKRPLYQKPEQPAEQKEVEKTETQLNS